MWRYKVTIERWRDGDTCDVVVDLVFRGILWRGGLRVKDLYCPELDQPGGVEAKAAAERLLPVGSVLTLESQKVPDFDRYARWVVALPSTADMISGGFGTVTPKARTIAGYLTKGEI